VAVAPDAETDGAGDHEYRGQRNDGFVHAELSDFARRQLWERHGGTRPLSSIILRQWHPHPTCSS
jgi:hypothetical protein